VFIQITLDLKKEKSSIFFLTKQRQRDKSTETMKNDVHYRGECRLREKKFLKVFIK
jgi:hypothetical protein